MLELKQGDIFESGAEALVNPVNCDGTMGKGLALEFRRRYPDNLREYICMCDNRWLQPGCVHVHEMESGYIINFPTKYHWREKSNLQDIELGLEDLRRTIVKLGIRSIAIPALGCGCGGLKWDEVRPLIERILGQLDAHIMVYEPREEKR